MAKPQAPEVVEPKPFATARVNAVFGDMRHLFTDKLIPQGGETKLEIDAWVQVQIDAGKLVIVQD